MNVDFAQRDVERVIKLRRIASETGGATENERAMAGRQLEKLELNNIGILEFVDRRVEEMERKEKERDFVRRTTGYEPPPEPGPGAGLFERAWHGAFRFAVGKAMDSLDEDEMSQAMHRKARKKKSKKPKKGLKTRMFEEVGVGLVAVEGDDAGMFLHLDLDIPLDLWDTILDAKTGPQRFAEWLDELSSSEKEI